MRTLVSKPLALAALVVFLASPAFAQDGPGSPLVDKLDISFNVGPIAAAVQMTNPVQLPTGMFKGTLHLQARDDTQTPHFNASLEVVGQAADRNTLLGGLLPAAIAVERELAAGVALDIAVADAQTKTGVTITSFHDPTAVEYAVMLALIIVVCITAISAHPSPVDPELQLILAELQNSLAAIDVTPPPSTVP